MQERSGAITMRGNPLTLVGTELSIGDSTPDIALLDNDLNPVRLSSFKGKICVVSTVPSLDTPDVTSKPAGLTPKPQTRR